METLKAVLTILCLLVLPHFCSHMTKSGRMQRQRRLCPLEKSSRRHEQTYLLPVSIAHQHRTTVRNNATRMSGNSKVRSSSSPYLERNRSTICIYHDVLKWIPTFTNLTSQLARWRLHLFKLDFDVEHCAGINAKTAVTVLRLDTTGQDRRSFIEDLPLFAINNGNSLHS